MSPPPGFQKVAKTDIKYPKQKITLLKLSLVLHLLKATEVKNWIYIYDCHKLLRGVNTTITSTRCRFPQFSEKLALFFCCIHHAALEHSEIVGSTVLHASKGGVVALSQCITYALPPSLPYEPFMDIRYAGKAFYLLLSWARVSR